MQNDVSSVLIKERFRLAGNLLSVRYLPSVFFHFKQITVFAARKTNLTAAPCSEK